MISKWINKHSDSLISPKHTQTLSRTPTPGTTHQTQTSSDFHTYVKNTNTRNNSSGDVESWGVAPGVHNIEFRRHFPEKSWAAKKFS